MKVSMRLGLFCSLLSMGGALSSCDDESKPSPSEPVCEGGACAQVEGGESGAAPTASGCVDASGEGRVAGEACGCGGQWSCEAGVFLCVGGTLKNVCGGCETLTEAL